MDRAASIDSIDEARLVEWFLQLTPAQRLAELESHIAALEARGFGPEAGLTMEPRDLLIPRR